MPNRSHLVAYWRTRLLASQQQCDEGSLRLRWLRRAYARIYRFLLSQYGDASEAGDAPLPDAPSNMPLVDNTRDYRGRPPKTIGTIQATLKHIHNACGRCDEPGPLAGGVPNDAWLVVASRRERWIPDKCQLLLRRHGIVAQVATRSGNRVVEVQRRDFGAAAALLETVRSSRGYRCHRHVSRYAPVLYGLVGGAVGMLIGLIFSGFFAWLNHNPAGALPLLYLFAGWGAAAGFVMGCVSLLGSIARQSTALQPATSLTSTFAGGVIGGFFGMSFGSLFLPWLAVVLFSFPENPEFLGQITWMSMTFGLLAGWVLGCWIGFRDFRSRTRTSSSDSARPNVKPAA